MLNAALMRFNCIINIIKFDWYYKIWLHELANQKDKYVMGVGTTKNKFLFKTKLVIVVSNLW